MKRNLLFFAVIAVLLSFAGCNTDDRYLMNKDYPADYDVEYGIRQVMQYDEVNINGIDVATKFAFFETLRFTIHFTDSKISAVTFTNGDVPFSPYDFTVPTEKVACYLNTDVLPNELRITATEQVLAYYKSGEFTVPFKLDCQALDYKYTFKSVNQ